MSGLEFMGEPPYTRIYLHGVVRDTQHRKMSKSLGNGIDPLEVVDRYGADALRYSLISGMSVGTDVILDPDDLESSFAPGRNFANKLWNAGRFILSNLPEPPRPLAGRSADVVRREELDPGRPLDHRAVRGDGARGDRGLRALPPQRGRRRGLSLHLERPGRLVHRADQAAPLRRRPGRRRGPRRGGPDLRRGAAAAAPGDAVRHRGAVAPVPRPRRRTRPSRSRPGPGPTGAPRIPRRCASSAWCRRWSARSGRSGPSTACSPASRCAPW